MGTDEHYYFVKEDADCNILKLNVTASVTVTHHRCGRLRSKTNDVAPPPSTSTSLPLYNLPSEMRDEWSQMSIILFCERAQEDADCNILKLNVTASVTRIKSLLRSNSNDVAPPPSTSLPLQSSD